MIVAVTGHRPDKLGGYHDHAFHHEIKMAMVEAFLDFKTNKVVSGMAIGVDTFAVQVARTLSIPYIAAIPFKGQELRWPDSSQIYYRDCLDNAEEVVTVCEGGYAPWKMQKRNEWMVDHCDILVAVWDGTSGGTNNCINYAVGKKPIYYIPITSRNGELHVGHFSPWWTQDIERESPENIQRVPAPVSL